MYAQPQTKEKPLKEKNMSWEQNQDEGNPQVSRGMTRVHHHDRFSILTPTPIRSFIEAGDDSIQLMSGDD